MALDGIYLYSLVQDLKKSILNSKIDKINQPEKDEIIITLRKDRKNIKLLISSSPKYPRLHITESIKSNPLQAPMFTMVLRKYLIGGKIVDIEQLDGDRILNMCIEASDELGFNSIYILVIEIMGRHSNITLVRQRDNKVMECIKHIGADINSYRLLYPGLEYKSPPKSLKLNPLNFTQQDLSTFIAQHNLEFNELFFSMIFTGISKPVSTHLFSAYNNYFTIYSIKQIAEYINSFITSLKDSAKYTMYTDNENNYLDIFPIPLLQYSNYKHVNFSSPHIMMDDFYFEKDKQERLKNRSTNIQKLLQTNIDRCQKKSLKLQELLRKCESKDTYRVKGDLLTSYIYSIKKGTTTVSLLNFYAETEEYIEISLDPYKSPSENIQSYYKKYNKLKKSEESALEQLTINDEELEYLLSVLTNIQNCESYNEIEDIKSELISTGYIKRKRENKNLKPNKSTKPLHYISSDGIDIYVGKNNLQNDFLSLKFANKNFMWLHTKNIPGSHVIICSNLVPDTTLMEAATLAAYYSKAKNSTKVPVDYTLVKNLKKPNGSKPGMVIYHTNFTINVEPTKIEELVIKKL